MSLIDSANLPCPRLELRWIKAGETWAARECAYSLVLPLVDYDIRREDEDGNKVRSELSVEIGRTRVEGGNGLPPIWNQEKVDTPFRDGAHALWDSEALGGIPIYAVCDDKAMLVEPRKDLA